MVYDLDGNGKAEVVVKTADGTKDGQGTVIGDETKDYRNDGGYILSGPEYLTLLTVRLAPLYRPLIMIPKRKRQ